MGCIPSKALLHATHLLHELKHSGPAMGVEVEGVRVDFAKMMAYKEGIVDRLTKGIAFLLKKNKVEHVRGVASLESATSGSNSGGSVKVRVGDTIYETKNVLLATGSKAMELPFLPFDEERVVSSTGALALKEIPKKLIIVGAGVIGLELGSVYQRLGSEIGVIEFLDRVTPEFDRDVSKNLQKTLEKQGFQFHLSSKLFEIYIEMCTYKIYCFIA